MLLTPTLWGLLMYCETRIPPTLLYPPQKRLRVELRIDGRIHVIWHGLHGDCGRGYLQSDSTLLPYGGVKLTCQTQYHYLQWLLRTIGGYILDYGLAGGPPPHLRDVWQYPAPPPKPRGQKLRVDTPSTDVTFAY